MLCFHSPTKFKTCSDFSVSSLVPGLFISILYSFEIPVDFSENFLLLISNLILPWSTSTFHVIWIPFHFIKILWLPRISSVLLNMNLEQMCILQLLAEALCKHQAKMEVLFRYWTFSLIFCHYVLIGGGGEGWDRGFWRGNQKWV